MQIDLNLKPETLLPGIERLFEIAGGKIERLNERWNAAEGAPVFTVNGKYSVRGWTDWTQGFQYGMAILAFEATGEKNLLEIGRSNTLAHMAVHVTHAGVHDHGFNNLSTYGNLRRLMLAGAIPENAWELHFYEMAIKASASAQALRWSNAAGGLGYVYSFNGPHSLFVDTIRSMRILGVAHQLKHVLRGENDVPISFLSRLISHGLATAKYNIYYGNARDTYDVRGRTAHESIFNPNDGRYRCPSSQQGYSPFSTWTRGLAWAMVGFAEELEFLKALPESDFAQTAFSKKQDTLATFVEAAKATCDFYIDHSALDGVPYWDTGAPGMVRLEGYQGRASDPFNEHEPIDSSAAAIAAQGLIRLGMYLGDADGKRYIQSGLSIARTLIAEPYLAADAKHEGILLHSVYHRPNGWDHIPSGRKVPCGESCAWGDYHLLELAVLIKKMVAGKYFTFFDGLV